MTTNACTFNNQVGRDDLSLGIVVAENIEIAKPNPVLEERLRQLLEQRRQPLTAEEEKIRAAGRDLLRNGSYKPTGRGKPAAEYLLREGMENQFPRVNTAVDIINYISLKYLVSISVWDIDLAQSRQFVFRLGKAGESYVFNQTGQVIALESLVTGFAMVAGQEIPIVTPVKDSLNTKTTGQSKNVAVAIYYPKTAGSRGHLNQMLQECGELLAIITTNTPWQQIV